ncbi:hypothetical protein [Streptomyces lavendulae]|uniref:hypothetical protein n=1 Tax=Streptomyces lavendulae TaxID=1914 RepID=UPI0036A1FBB3
MGDDQRGTHPLSRAPESDTIASVAGVQDRGGLVKDQNIRFHELRAARAINWRSSAGR